MMKRIDFGTGWALAPGIGGDYVVLTVTIPLKESHSIPFPMTPKLARELGVALVALARVIDAGGAENARLLAEAEADVEAMLKGSAGTIGEAS